MKILVLFSLFFSLAATADTLSLHLFRSPKGISWKNPFQMTYTTLKNSLVKYDDRRVYSISHVFVEVKCDSTGEHILRGQTSIPDSNERELVLKKGYGMGVMFGTQPGVLEKNDVIIRDMKPYEYSSLRSRAAFKISPSTCQRMLKYAREYEERGYGLTYAGLQADPLKGESAGCSAFGVSFLRVGGLMGPFTREWQEIINVPKRFIGGPLTGKKVPITKLLLHPFAPWAPESEPHIHLEAWNPERIHSWVKKVYQQVEAGQYQGPHVEIESTGDSKSVEIDLSDLPTPQGPIWLI